MATEIITGFQWGDGNRFIGPYEFENNKDQEAIHLPPKTTLIEPPAPESGKVILWDVARSRWFLQDLPPPAPVYHPSPAVEVSHDH